MPIYYIEKEYKKYLHLIENKLNQYLSVLGVGENFKFYITGSWGTKHQKGNDGVTTQTLKIV